MGPLALVGGLSFGLNTASSPRSTSPLSELDKQIVAATGPQTALLNAVMAQG